MAPICPRPVCNPSTAVAAHHMPQDLDAGRWGKTSTVLQSDVCLTNVRAQALQAIRAELYPVLGCGPHQGVAKILQLYKNGCDVGILWIPQDGSLLGNVFPRLREGPSESDSCMSLTPDGCVVKRAYGSARASPVPRASSLICWRPRASPWRFSEPSPPPLGQPGDTEKRAAKHVPCGRVLRGHSPREDTDAESRRRRLSPSRPPPRN